MDWDSKQVRKAFNGRLIGSRLMKKVVCQSLLCLPTGMVNYITSSVWFISSSSDAWAFTLKGSDVKGQYLIFLPEELFRQHDHHIQYTVLHEIGHIFLGHNNSMGFRQSKTEIKQQEKEADRFAREYLTSSS